MSSIKKLPNLISISRGAAALTLLFTTVFSLPFWLLYIWCGTSDMIDGPLARRLNVESKTGAAIDSVADLIFVIVAAIKIIPKISIPGWLWWVIGIVAIAQIARITFLYCKERNCSAFHDIPNKVIGVALYFVPFIICINAHANTTSCEGEPYGLCIISESGKINTVNGDSFYLIDCR